MVVLCHHVSCKWMLPKYATIGVLRFEFFFSFGENRECWRSRSLATSDLWVTKHIGLWVILGLHREVDENCSLLGYNAASSGTSLPSYGEPRRTQLALRLLFMSHASVSLKAPVYTVIFTACIGIGIINCVYVMVWLFFVSCSRHVLNVVFFLLDDSLASEFYMLTFRSTLFHLHRRCIHRLWRWNRQRVSIRRNEIQTPVNHLKERIQHGITTYVQINLPKLGWKESICSRADATPV